MYCRENRLQDMWDINVQKNKYQSSHIYGDVSVVMSLFDLSAA
jgi:hypothetical protein